jgi:hypothetical protein
MTCLRSLIVAGLLVAFPVIAQAQTSYRWTGTTSGAWNTTTNWLDDSNGATVSSVPNLATHSAVFRLSSTNTTLNLATSIALLNLQFTATPSAYTIGGQGITFASGGSISVASTVTTNQTINSNIVVAGAFGITNSSATSGQTLTLGGTMALASNALTVNSTANTTLTGAITGLAASSITKSGSGTLTLSATNSALLGNMTVNAGTLNLNGSGTTGTGAVTVNTGATLAGTGTVTGTATVNIGGTIRGDTGAGTGNLKLSSNTVITGDSSALASNIRTSLAVSSGTITANSKLSLVGTTNTLKLDNVNGTNRGINVYLDNDAGLTLGQSYTITLAVADTASTTRFLRNNSGNNSGSGLFGAADVNLFSGTGGYTFNSVLLNRGVLGNNTLDLTFTPVPEPSLLFGAAVGLFGLVALRKNFTT